MNSGVTAAPFVATQTTMSTDAPAQTLEGDSVMI